MIENIKPGKVSGVFLISSIKSLRTEDKRPYTLFEFKDRVAKIKAFLWNASINYLKPGDFVKITCEAQEHKNELVLRLSESAITKIDTPENMHEYVYALDDITVKNLWIELMGFVNSVQDKEIVALLKYFMSQHESIGEFSLLNCPMGVDIYSNYAGGLLEHVVYSCRHAKNICRNYFDRNTPIDPDLLTAILILHDTGKLKAYKNILFPEKTTLGLTVQEEILGVQVINELISGAKVKQSKKMQKITMAVLNNKPKFIEEIICQKLHEMDALLGRYSRAINFAKSDDELIYIDGDPIIL